MKGSFIGLADGYRKVVSKKKVKLRHSKMNKLTPRVVVYLAYVSLALQSAVLIYAVLVPKNKPPPTVKKIVYWQLGLI